MPQPGDGEGNGVHSLMTWMVLVRAFMEHGLWILCVYTGSLNRVEELELAVHGGQQISLGKRKASLLS